MTNFILITLLGLPTFCFSVLLLFLLISQRDNRVNYFLVIGCSLIIMQFIFTGIFWYHNPTTNELEIFTKISGIVFSPAMLLILFGGIFHKIGITESFDRKSVLKLVAWLILTLGFYTAYWYLKQNVKDKLKSTLIIPYIILITIAYNSHIYLIESNESIGILKLILVVIAISYSTYLTFRLRYIIRNEKNIEIDPVLTFLLGPLYLQFVVNRNI